MYHVSLTTGNNLSLSQEAKHCLAILLTAAYLCCSSSKVLVMDSSNDLLTEHSNSTKPEITITKLINVQATGHDVKMITF